MPTARDPPPEERLITLEPSVMIKIQAQALLLSAVIGANGKPNRRLVCSAWRRHAARLRMLCCQDAGRPQRRRASSASVRRRFRE